jgi:hypothetical protein
VHLIAKVETHHGNVEARDFVAVKIRNFENVARALAEVLKGTGNLLSESFSLISMINPCIESDQLVIQLVFAKNS